MLSLGSRMVGCIISIFFWASIDLDLHHIMENTARGRDIIKYDVPCRATLSFMLFLTSDEVRCSTLHQKSGGICGFQCWLGVHFLSKQSMSISGVNRTNGTAGHIARSSVHQLATMSCPVLCCAVQP